MNRKELQSLARVRIAEATTLLNAGFPDGAYYLGGYSVECALKACIAKQTRMHDFPDRKIVDSSYTHDLKKLVQLAKLEPARVAAANEDPVLRDYWDIVQRWSEDSRYEMHGAGKADELLNALADRRHGVLKWLKRHW